jgi:serine/threonine protein phosphatase PrpC
MLISQENDHADNSQHTYASTDRENAGCAGQRMLTLRVGGYQDRGIRRKHKPNEDTIFIMQGNMPSDSGAKKPFVLLAVADGMGGHENGRTASRLASRSLAEYVSGSLRYKQKRPEALLSLLTAGVQYANQVVYERNQEQQSRMGTTMTAALISGDSAYIAHVGDSRLYINRPASGLTQITQDHSYVAALVASGIIAPEDIYTHPRRNIIYRCLGKEAAVEIETSTVQLASGDMLLLCSDGLWEMVRDQQIASILTTPMFSLLDNAHVLILAALEGSGIDNVSAIVAQVSDEGLATGDAGTPGNASAIACWAGAGCSLTASLPIA